MKTAIFIFGILAPVLVTDDKPELKMMSSATIDSLGACQGAAYVDGKVYLYGDRETGMIREYAVKDGSLQYSGKEIKLTVESKDVINHPTGIAYQPGKPFFIGNSIRLNPEGTSWKAILYQIDWETSKKKGTLDGNLIRTIEDDACIQGTRPEYVRYRGKWFVASADYGDKKNEVRLYDPEALANADKTSKKGVLFKKFSCGAWVQNLHWVKEKGILILIQNQIEGRKWRFTFLDLEKSVRAGEQHVIRTVDIDKADELEGFTFTTDNNTKGIAVTSSRKENVHFVDVNW
ncbi:hypothetical protein [Dyadobacter bucti]|uniref:hypothetical protein n=1 Tax=Dyadobacter bucti TaxID=2572203 RepID=UPI0011086698|nr:hypothetical protein [Dyadobacter bucti]